MSNGDSGPSAQRRLTASGAPYVQFQQQYWGNATVDAYCDNLVNYSLTFNNGASEPLCAEVTQCLVVITPTRCLQCVVSKQWNVSVVSGTSRHSR